MVPLEDIKVSGKAPNRKLNSTTADAEQMLAYFKQLFFGSSARADGIFINTTESNHGTAYMIDLDEVEPKPAADDKFYYHMKVYSPTLGEQLWHVGSWFTAVENRGLEAATREKMLLINPEFTYLNFTPTYDAISATLAELYKP